MAGQLSIFERDERRCGWVIDEATRAAGRKGIAEARAALRAALDARHRREAATSDAQQWAA